MIGDWGESNWKAVSFRVACACVRALLVMRLASAEKVSEAFFPFPFCVAGSSFSPADLVNELPTRLLLSYLLSD